MAFLVKALFSWNECLKDADISILGNFLATFSSFFSQYGEILRNTIYMPNFKSTGPFKHQTEITEGEAESANLPPICKKPDLLNVKQGASQMVDLERSDFYVVFTMSFCAFALQLLISLLFQIIRL